MRALEEHEAIQRGSPDFPLDYYYLDAAHPRYEMPYHWHEEFELLHVLSGQFSLSVDDAAYSLLPGDIAFISGGCLHGGTPEKCAYECVVFDLRLLLKTGEPCKGYISDILHRRTAVRPIFPVGDGKAEGVLLPMFEALSRGGTGRELITLGCLYQFIGLVYGSGAYQRCQTPPTAEAQNILRLKKVFEMIETQYRQPLSLKRLSAAAGMTPKYFCRFFKEATHRTPMDYVNYYRIEMACYQLDAADANVTESAMELGYSDVNYFIRCFKKYKGVTPGQYLRQNRK